MLRAMEKAGLVGAARTPRRAAHARVPHAGRPRRGKELREVAADYVNETIATLPERDRRELARLLDELGASIRRASAARGPAARRGRPVIRLLRKGLRPYWGRSSSSLVLLLVQAIANLYLPTLNADIINNGVVTGDTAYILEVGAIMLGVTLIFVIASIVAVYWGSKTLDGLRPRHARRAVPPRRELLPGRGQPASARRRSSRAPPTTCSRCRWWC